MVTRLEARPALGGTHLRAVFGAVPTPVVAVCAVVDGTPVGMVFSSFATVSLDPPLASVCAARSSRTWPVLRRARRLGVTVLSACHGEVPRQLSGPAGDRFTGLTLHGGAHGALLLDGGTAWLECSVEAEIAAGDHDVVLLAIHALDADPAATPLVYRHSRTRPLP
jgi:flavin reductase (DIM6/NTAB) family NADH-FMN oxidoreductase RutF